MKTILHVLTKENDLLAAEIISRQQSQAGSTIEVVDLTKPAPDYPALLEKIFAAESVAVW